MEASDLVGRYTLLSCHRADGTQTYGERPEGHLHYAEDGRMSILIMRRDRRPIGLDYDQLMRARSALRRPWTLLYRLGALRALRRFVEAAAGFAGYEAAYRVEGDTVIHTVGVGLVPDRTGTEFTRTLVVDGDRVTINTPEGDALVWERLPG